MIKRQDVLQAAKDLACNAYDYGCAIDAMDAILVKYGFENSDALEIVFEQTNGVGFYEWFDEEEAVVL